MGAAYSTHWGNKSSTILAENRDGKDHFGDMGVDVRIILKWALH
jgi:hypothetical protein